MSQLTIQIDRQPQQDLWGLWCRCTPSTAAHSSQVLAAAYGKAAPRGNGPSFPFFILSRGRGEGKEEYDLFAGGVRPGEELGEYALPEGMYASVEVSPRFGIAAFWNSTLEETRRKMLAQLAEEGWRPLGLEYQLHGEESLRRPPVIRLVMAVERAEEADQ